MEITKSHFGTTHEGVVVELFTLANDNQVTVKITNYGAIITSVETPDKYGAIANIALGFEKFEDYISPGYLGSYPYFGCVCGRVCNRIAEGRFTLEGKNYSLAVNNGPNHLHGGLVGFDKRIWDAEVIEKTDQVGVKLTYFSPDMEEGYPGNLKVDCTYTLNNKNELSIEYAASTDQATIVNLTNHTYFNLTGGKSQILNHELEMPAKWVTPAINSIPTGELAAVDGTPFDFRKRQKLGTHIPVMETGYDHNLVLGNSLGELIFAGRLCEETSGRKVDVYTTQPGVQLYTGYWIPELTVEGKKKFGSFSGVALETQHFPDSINKPNFPSVTLNPRQAFLEKTVYSFNCK